MKKLYFNLAIMALCLSVFTSCSHKINFVTKGLPNTDSSYLVTTEGKHIDASVIEVKKNNKLFVDGQERSLDNLSAIRSKKMYFGVKDDHLYFGESYGRICVLYELVYGTMYQPNARMASGGFTGNGTPGGYTSTTTKIEYLQKLGSSDIDRLNVNTLIDYVSDNEEAVAIAKSAKTWRTVSNISLIGFIGSGVYGSIVAFKNRGDHSDVNPPSINAALIAMGSTLGVDIIAATIEGHKTRKAIRIYNSSTSEPTQ